MGRGADTGTQSAADQERARQDAINQQLLAEREQGRNLLLPSYQQLLANPGFSEAEKAAITGQGLGALGSAFGAAQDTAANRLARTGNTAGYAELEDELAREQGRQAADVTRQSQVDFADKAFQDRMAALAGIGRLYGIDTNALMHGLGIDTGLLNVRAQAGRPGGGFGFGIGPFSFRTS